jgi:hypothetical protein
VVSCGGIGIVPGVGRVRLSGRVSNGVNNRVSGMVSLRGK